MFKNHSSSVIILTYFQTFLFLLFVGSSDEESSDDDSDGDYDSDEEGDGDDEELDDSVCPPGCDQVYLTVTSTPFLSAKG